MSNDLKPSPAVTVLSKLPIVLFCVVMLAMLGIMITGTNETIEEAKPKTEEVVITPPELDTQEKAGISEMPKPEEEPPPLETVSSPNAGPKVVTVIRDAPTAEDRKRFSAEKALLRSWRIERQKKALEAPMRVELASVKKVREETGQAPANPAQSSTARPANGVRNELQNELSEHVASLARDRKKTGYDDRINDRIDKEEFGERSHESQWTSPYRRDPGARYEVKTGTLIPSILLTGVNSDLPGQITAQVSQNVWDTATGRYLLIPQGSRLLGVYDSRVVTGQERVLIAWNRVIFPDGSSLTLEAMPGVDQAGYSGFHDQVDNHYFAVFGQAILMSLITGLSSYAVDTFGETGSGSADNPTLQSELGTSLATSLGQAGAKLLERNMAINPTLEIRPGYRFNVVTVKDLAFRGPYAGVR